MVGSVASEDANTFLTFCNSGSGAVHKEMLPSVSTKASCYGKWCMRRGVLNCPGTLPTLPQASLLHVLEALVLTVVNTAGPVFLSSLRLVLLVVAGFNSSTTSEVSNQLHWKATRGYFDGSNKGNSTSGCNIVIKAVGRKHCMTRSGSTAEVGGVCILGLIFWRQVNVGMV